MKKPRRRHIITLDTWKPESAPYHHMIYDAKENELIVEYKAPDGRWTTCRYTLTDWNGHLPVLEEL